MTRFIVAMLAAASLSAAQGKPTAQSKPGAQSKQTFNGTITDSMCAKADHSQMQMGPTDADCTKACVSGHGASYVLYDGKTLYALSNQEMPARFAGSKVVVTGVLDAARKTITVESISAPKK